jgi:hypothetical protein
MHPAPDSGIHLQICFVFSSKSKKERRTEKALKSAEECIRVYVAAEFEGKSKSS